MPFGGGVPTFFISEVAIGFVNRPKVDLQSLAMWIPFILNDFLVQEGDTLPIESAGECCAVSRPEIQICGISEF
jgi:hypothetical protein